MKVENRLKEEIDQLAEEIDFSGALLATKQGQPFFEMVSGFANRSEMVPIRIDTRFGIASGCKIFTATLICKLVEEGKLTFETTLKSVLKEEFPHFDPTITVHHLLTHTSGIPDYFDEETMEDFAELWKERPMYRMENLSDFLPMFQHLPMKFSPGEKFHYNNAGYIVLGLLIEAITGFTFREQATKQLFQKSGMNDSGYFFMDRLPANTALGYISENQINSYALPIVGGSDGGAYTTAVEMDKFWTALFSNKLLSPEMTSRLLTPHVEAGDDFYGYGVWIRKQNGKVKKFHVMGYDPGVSFHSGYYPDTALTITCLSNKSRGAYPMMAKLEELVLNES